MKLLVWAVQGKSILLHPSLHTAADGDSNPLLVVAGCPVSLSLTTRLRHAPGSEQLATLITSLTRMFFWFWLFLVTAARQLLRL